MHHLVFGADYQMGILPANLLNDKFKCTKEVKEDMLSGIGSERLFFERSSVSRNLMFPIFLGTFPVRCFLDKFSVSNAVRLVISSGIPPIKLFHERSMVVTNWRVLPYSSSLPFVIMMAFST